MIQRIVAGALRAPFLVLAAAALLVCVGLAAYKQLDIEAYPNPVPPLVEVITQPPGWSAEETERYVTIPLEIGLSGMPGLDHIRSQSLFGLSDVKCYFNWNSEYKEARQEVINRIQFVSLPAGLGDSFPPGTRSERFTATASWARGTASGTSRPQRTGSSNASSSKFRESSLPSTNYMAARRSKTTWKLHRSAYAATACPSASSRLPSPIVDQNGRKRPSIMGEQSFDVRGIGLARIAFVAGAGHREHRCLRAEGHTGSDKGRCGRRHRLCPSTWNCGATTKMRTSYRASF